MHKLDKKHAIPLLCSSLITEAMQAAVLVIYFSDSSMFFWNNGRCYQLKPTQRLLKESIGYMLCVVYCLSVCMLGLCMYGGAAYPGSDKAVCAKHWAIISLIEEQFSCS